MRWKGKTELVERKGGGCANLESRVLRGAGAPRQISRGNRFPRPDEKWYAELIPPVGGKHES
jgi:hypothetical protein